MTDKISRIDQLLNMAWNTKSTARTLAIVNQILEIAPENVDALIMRADCTDDPEERTAILFRALDALGKPGNFHEDDREILFYVVNQRLAFTFFYTSQFDEALKYCEAALNSPAAIDDPDAEAGISAMRSLYYRLLVERREWQKILAEAMRDEERSLARGYARLVAAWMLAPEDSRKICANIFWDVLLLAPDVPFYMLGYFPEPEDSDSQEAHNEFDFALLFYDTISVADDFFQWFNRGTILFGLLSGRFDGRERDYMIDALDSLGGYEEYEKMNELIAENTDDAIIEMLAANKCLTE